MLGLAEAQRVLPAVSPSDCSSHPSTGAGSSSPRTLKNVEQQVAWRRRREVRVASDWPWIHRLAPLVFPRQQATRHRNPGVDIGGDRESSSRNLVQTRGVRKGSCGGNSGSIGGPAAWKAARNGGLPVQLEAGGSDSRLCPPLRAPTTRPVLGTGQKSRVNKTPAFWRDEQKAAPPGN